MVNKLRLGLIGLGTISKYYLAALDKSNAVELVSLCDSNEERLRQVGSQLSGVALYPNSHSLLNQHGIDAVAITLPNDLHYGVALDALHSGKHVLVEKPMTINVAEAEALVRASQSLHLTLMTAFHRRYNLNFEDLVKNPLAYGKIKSFHARYLEQIVDHSAGNLDPKKTGGGCVIDNGSNVVDILRYIVGELEVVDSELTYRNGVDAIAKVKFVFNGGTGTMHLDWFYDGEVKDIIFETEQGIVPKDFLKKSTQFKGSLYHEYERVLDDFAKTVAKGGCHGQDGLAALNLVKKIYSKGLGTTFL